MDESAPLPPRSPSSGIAILGSSDDLINLPAPKLMGRVTSRKHRRKKSRISPLVTITAVEGLQTPPLRSPNGDSKMDKKRSPTSTFDFENVEEMKVAVNDESYQESIVRILHKKLASPSLERHSHAVVRSKSLEENEKRDVMSAKERPLVTPEQNSSVTHANEHEGELAMMNLADDCLANQDATTALAIYKSLLQELDKKYGRDNALTAHCVHKLGEANLLLGDFRKAINYLDTAINIRSVVLGVHHIDVANSMEKLAVAQLHLNEVETAHDVYRRALRIKRSFLGLYHEDVAHIQTQLACIYFYSGELLSAQATFEEALDVYRHLSSQPTAIHGFWAVKSADTLCSIGSIKLKQKNYSRAIGYFVDALKAQKQVYGLYHPLVIITLDNMGYAHAKNKSFHTASEVYEEMLHAQTTFFQGYNLDCYETLKKLSLVYCKVDKLYSAIDATLEAISLQQRGLSRDELVFDKTKKLLHRLQKKLPDENQTNRRCS